MFLLKNEVFQELFSQSDRIDLRLTKKIEDVTWQCNRIEAVYRSKDVMFNSMWKQSSRLGIGPVKLISKSVTSAYSNRPSQSHKRRKICCNSCNPDNRGVTEAEKSLLNYILMLSIYLMLRIIKVIQWTNLFYLNLFNLSN